MNILANMIEYFRSAPTATSPVTVPAPIRSNYNQTFQYGFGDYVPYFNEFTPIPACPLCGEELQVKKLDDLFAISHNPNCAIKVWGFAESRSQINSIWSSVIQKLKG
jgi:hypothetical protein